VKKETHIWKKRHVYKKRPHQMTFMGENRPSFVIKKKYDLWTETLTWQKKTINGQRDPFTKNKY